MSVMVHDESPDELVDGAWVRVGMTERWEPAPLRLPSQTVMLEPEPREVAPLPCAEPVEWIDPPVGPSMGDPARRAIWQDVVVQLGVAETHGQEHLGRICDDCGGLVFVSEFACPVCLLWATRVAARASWARIGDRLWD